MRSIQLIENTYDITGCAVVIARILLLTFKIKIK